MRRRRDQEGIAHVLLVALLVVLAALVFTSVVQAPGDREPAPASDVAAITRAINPSVVVVTASLGGSRGRIAATGVVLTATGSVLTNNHVVVGATNIRAQLGGKGREYAAAVAGYSVKNDIAVLQLVGASGLPVAPIGDPDSARVGDRVVAIGNALGRGGAPRPEAGTITAFGQRVTATDNGGNDREMLTDMIQVAASVQPGDSGGPLVNAAGRVIGITTAASVRAGALSGGAGTGFAIPIDRAKAIAAQIRAGRSSATVHAGPRAVLGVTIKSPASDPGPGVVVGLVNKNGPAGVAGVRPDDVIESVDDQDVASVTDVNGALDRYRPGDVVRLGWTDTDGHFRTGSVRLVAGPSL